MTPEDLSAFTRVLARNTREFVSASLEKAISGLRDQVLTKLSELEQRVSGIVPVTGPQGDPGAPGQDGAIGPVGPAGKDASAEQIKAAVDAAVAVERLTWQSAIRDEVTKAYAALPVPRDGKDSDVAALLALQASVSAMQGEWQAFKAWQAERPVTPAVNAEAIEHMLQKHLETARMPARVVDEGAMAERVKSAVFAALPVLKDGRDGVDGKDGVSIDPAVVDVMVAGAVEKAYRDAPKPKDGRDGIDGKDGVAGKDGASVTADDVLPPLRTEIQAALSKALDAMPKPKDGRDGQDGKDGTSVTLDDVRPALQVELQKAIEALPTPQDGKDGAIGASGPAGEPGPIGPQGPPGPPGERGSDGAPGKDGRDGLPGVPGQVGEKGLGGQDGRDGVDGTNGRDGIDGKDGLGFDAVDLLFDEEQKSWAFRLESEDGRRKDFPFPLPFDAGVYHAGELYKQASGVTHKRAYWVALRDTRGTPGESRDWRMVLKGGRDGRDAPPRES